MLWTSPEILRENFPPPRGTVKGDIFSMAIIFYEIMMRSEPFDFDKVVARGNNFTYGIYTYIDLRIYNGTSMNDIKCLIF